MVPGQANPGKELEQGNKNKRKVKVYSKFIIRKVRG